MEDSLLSDNPLIKTLPPATDYLNYLILVEHHLTKKQLPIFHNILQDIQLTANIGWDLVHLLLPLLPESEQCLQDVARLGNPREVVLKVTELLGDIEEEEECNDEELGDLKNVSSTGNQGRPDQDHLPSEEVENVTTDLPNLNSRSQVYCILRYINLVHMLAILHPRIKTKYPSRFLSTSLQAVLPAFSYVAQYSIATEATLDLIKALSPNPRPRLPPRKSSSQVPTVASVPASAPDPEAQDASMGPEEEALQRRLVQAFLTFVVEGYVSSIKACEDIPGLAWSCRYYEKIHPERAVPGRLTYLDMFVSEEEKLHSLDTVLGQCLAISRDLKMTSEELLSAMLQEDPDNEEENMDDELPSKASDVPLSRNGSLHLFCASLASYTLFDSPVKPPTPSLYPEFSMMLSKILGPSASSTLGQENVVSLDALLFLGCYIVKSTQTVDPTGNPEIRDILQRLALLSANIPSAALRYQAHLLTSTILHRYLLPDVRLAFIKDTLEHCPYENLKASAVGWLKDEILNAQKLISDVSRGNTGTADVSVFATREILLTIGPLLLVDASILVKSDLKSAFGIDTPPLQRFQAYAAFEQFQPFVLAVLNLIFLLLSSPGIFSCLEIKSIGPAFDMIRYCDRMRAASLLFQGWLAEEDTKNRESSKSPAQVDAEKQARRAKMLLLDQTIDRVMEAAGAAGLP